MQPISGVYTLNAYGTCLGGGWYFLTSRDGSPIKHGLVIDLAHDIYEEKTFFRKYFVGGLYEAAFIRKPDALVFMMRKVYNASLYVLFVM
jgi:hypothetical protein